jgi:uncharacterized protein
MSVFLVVLGVLIVLAGVATLVLPAVPGVAIIYLGVLVVAWADQFTRIGPLVLIVLAIIMLVALVADNLAGLFGVRRAGASGWGVFGAGVGALVGLFFGLPGVVLGPAAGALVFEYIKNPDLVRAGRAGLGGLFGFILGIITKCVFGMMIVALALLAYLF